jgi:hypothetical protein
MTDDDKEAAARDGENIERYRYLLGFIRDTKMRAILEKLLKEAQDRVTEIESRQRQNPT